MTYALAFFTLWFFGTNGHVVRGDTYRSETECVEVVEAYKKAAKTYQIDAICIRAGKYP
jgi:hypothetical protein